MRLIGYLASRLGGIRVCDIRCDVNLKIRLFYILITNIMSNNNKYCSKKITNVNIVETSSLHPNFRFDYTNYLNAVLRDFSINNLL